MNQKIIDDLNRLLAEKLHIEAPAPDTDLIETGLLDSLRLVELLLHIELELGSRIAIEEIDLDDLRSVARIARLIAARSARPAPVPA
ncbi:MAG TPA: phosphopantetheine-binding protein [Burkholderiales bacterium]|nr:phosphopantetheine-binding protein [Burkholderiales bacterium]